MKTSFGFVKQGFILLNKNLDLYIIWVALLFLGDVPVLGIIFSFIYFGFDLSVPKLLEIDRSRSRYKDIFNIAIKNTLRIIFPMFILMFLVVIIFFVLAVLLKANPLEEFKTLSIGASLLTNLISSIILSLGTFTAVYFSLEKSNIFKAIYRSILLSFKNLNYIFVIAVVSFLPGLIYDLFGHESLALLKIVGSYVQIGILMSSVVFYKDLLSRGRRN